MKERISGILTKYDKLIEQRDEFDNLIKGLEIETEALAEERDICNMTWEALRVVLDKYSNESIEKLKEMLNKGVQAIFYDRLYTIDFEISDTKRKMLDIILVEDKGTYKLRSVVPKRVGGGITTVISFIFEIFLIILYEKRRFILLDEQLTQISSNYIESFMEFVKYLHTELGFDFLFVNHDPRFNDYFDHVYEVNSGNIILKK